MFWSEDVEPLQWGRPTSIGSRTVLRTRTRTRSLGNRWRATPRDRRWAASITNTYNNTNTDQGKKRFLRKHQKIKCVKNLGFTIFQGQVFFPKLLLCCKNLNNYIFICLKFCFWLFEVFPKKIFFIKKYVRLAFGHFMDKKKHFCQNLQLKTKNI